MERFLELTAMAVMPSGAAQEFHRWLLTYTIRNFWFAHGQLSLKRHGPHFLFPLCWGCYFNIIAAFLWLHNKKKYFMDGLEGLWIWAKRSENFVHPKAITNIRHAWDVILIINRSNYLYLLSQSQTCCHNSNPFCLLHKNQSHKMVRI